MSRFFRFGVFVALLFGSVSVSASIVVRHSFTELCERADSIVHARVLEQQSQWRDGRIVTEVTLEVLESLKGEYHAAERVVVLNHGGVVGTLVTRISGAPVFFDGEEVVLFLEHNVEVGLPLVTGMSQGKFTVTVDGEARFVTQSTEGLILVAPDQIEATVEPREPVTIPEVSSPPEVTFPIPLDTFLNDVRSAVEHQP